VLVKRRPAHSVLILRARQTAGVLEGLATGGFASPYCDRPAGLPGRLPHLALRVGQRWEPNGIRGGTPNLSNEIDKLRWTDSFPRFATGMAEVFQAGCRKRGKVLLVRRRSDGLWIVPRAAASAPREFPTRTACAARDQGGTAESLNLAGSASGRK